MSETTATLSAAAACRTEYLDGGIVTAASLAGDSAANANAWERHQQRAHRWGIVAGLYVTIDKLKSGKQVVCISTGAAIDPDGRLLTVGPSFPKVPIPAGADDFSVCLFYGAERVPGPADFDRYAELPRVQLVTATNGAEGCRSTAMGVLLGQVKSVPYDPGYHVYVCGRRYVGAIGNRIDAPSGRATLALGPQYPGDVRQFAIEAQADQAQPPRTVLARESTGTIRFSSLTSVALPHEKVKADVVEQPPIVVAGCAAANVTPADILDPCQLRQLLCVTDRDNNSVIPVELRGLLAPCDWLSLSSAVECQDKLRSLLVRILNCIIRAAADTSRDVAQNKYRPRIGSRVVTSADQLYTVAAVDPIRRSCDLDDDRGGSLFDVPWIDVVPPYWSPDFVTNRGILAADNALTKVLANWRQFAGNMICRLLLDHLLSGALRPLVNSIVRGVVFQESGTADIEPPASRIHLAEFKQDGQTYRQLRITIRDPGKDNQPHRYRCSLGTTEDCDHPPVPTIQKPLVWNRQTSFPRGILSVLADKSVDIHDQLNVYPTENSLLPGMVLKLKPSGDGGASGSGSGGSGSAGGPNGASIPAAPIIENAVVWEGQKLQRNKVGATTNTVLVLDGALHNLGDQDIASLQIIVSMFGKDDTTNGPTHVTIGIRDSDLPALQTKPISTIAQPASLQLAVPTVWDSRVLIVNLLIMGVNQQNFVICTQIREELAVPS